MVGGFVAKRPGFATRFGLVWGAGGFGIVEKWEGFGSELWMSITVGRVEFMGEVVGATIVMGDDESEPLLGVTPLESVGIAVDPRNQELRRSPFARLRQVV